MEITNPKNVQAIEGLLTELTQKGLISWDYGEDGRAERKAFVDIGSGKMRIEVAWVTLDSAVDCGYDKTGHVIGFYAGNELKAEMVCSNSAFYDLISELVEKGYQQKAEVRKEQEISNKERAEKEFAEKMLEDLKKIKDKKSGAYGMENAVSELINSKCPHCGGPMGKKQ